MRAALVLAAPRIGVASVGRLGGSRFSHSPISISLVPPTDLGQERAEKREPTLLWLSVTVNERGRELVHLKRVNGRQREWGGEGVKNKNVQ